MRHLVVARDSAAYQGFLIKFLPERLSVDDFCFVDEPHRLYGSNGSKTMVILWGLWHLRPSNIEIVHVAMETKCIIVEVRESGRPPLEMPT